MRKMIDVFSGLGGASEAFVRHPGWEVLRIENNPLLSGVPETTIMDAREFKKIISGFKDEIGVVDLMWFSPPCRDFSLGFNSPRAIAARMKEEYHPSMELVDLCLELVDIIQPRFFVIENVRGAIEFFEPILGPPRQIIGSFFLWGNFPLVHVDPDFKHNKADVDTWSDDPLRANKKAVVPLAISQALLEAVMSQRTLEYWI